MGDRAGIVAQAGPQARPVTAATGAGTAGSPIRVLFVCTGNSARSVMAETLLRHRGGSNFEVHSAGTEPRGINPLTVRVLAEAGLPATGLRSKSVDEFLDQPFDYVITVCDHARQVCPVFPGGHESLHWGYEDPALATGSDEERLAVFRRIFTQIGERIGLFVPLALRARTEAGAAGIGPGR
jgi:arsenate reductase